MGSTAIMLKPPNSAVLSGYDDLNYYLYCGEVTTTGIIMPLHPSCLITIHSAKNACSFKLDIHTCNTANMCNTSQKCCDCYHLENDSQPKEHSEDIQERNKKILVKNRYIAIQLTISCIAAQFCFAMAK